jgi:hypothetical protein
MYEGQSNYPKFHVHGQTLSITEIVSGSRKLRGARKRDQSLFSLLLEIESRLRKEGRNDQVKQPRLLRKKDGHFSRVNLSRYCE